MSFFGAASQSLSRRGLLTSGGIFAAASVLMTPGLALANGAIDVTAAPYGASPSKADNSAAFQAALNAIAGNGGGHLYVPGGNYVLASPLSYTGGALTVVGDGADNSVLINSHSGTVLTVNFGDTSKCLTMRSLGFSPCPGGTVAQGAIAVVVAAQPSGWQNVVIEDVCIGVPWAMNGAQYTSYKTAISLTNTNRARINNANVHANNIQGGTAVALSGICYDTRILGCTIEGYSYGVGVLSYCEGLHLANNVIICGTAVYTGATNYNTGIFAINLLELLMSDCEINTSAECLNLYQVKNAQIVNCHFTGPKTSGGAAIDMRGCSECLVENSTFCGVWAPGNAAVTGIALMPSSRIPTNCCNLSNVQFENTTTAIYFGTGAQANTASNVGLLLYGTGALVNGVAAYGPQMQQVFVDASGNTTNNASWMTTANTASAVTGRRVNSQH
jgi:hypothetical protein